MSVKTVWADRDSDGPTISGPYDGLLLIMNIGDESNRESPLPYDYDRSLREAMANAHASGWAIVYCFDKGTENPPEDFDFVDGQDHLRLMGETCKRPEADFSGMPEARMGQLTAMAQATFDKTDTFKFTQRAAMVAGRCRIEGLDALLPVTSLRF